MPRDYYEVLGVPRTAGEAEIKKAYRQLAMQFHQPRSLVPDGNDDAQFNHCPGILAAFAAFALLATT